jgi:hypothetical protein
MLTDGRIRLPPDFRRDGRLTNDITRLSGLVLDQGAAAKTTVGFYGMGVSSVYA